MSRDEGGPPDLSLPLERDPDATQAWTPTFGDGVPGEPVAPSGPDWSAESLLPIHEVESAATVEPAEHGALDELFAPHRFEEVGDTPLVPVFGERNQTPAAAAAAPVAARREPLSDAQRNRLLLSVAGGAVGVLLLAGLFLLGTRLGGLPAESEIPVTAAPIPSAGGPVEPGLHAWSELRGGECLEPYSDPWASEFMVVDCREPHTAQLTRRGTYAEAMGVVSESGELTVPVFPGVEILAADVDALCAVALDFTRARDITDGLMQGTFPVSAEEWEADPSYSCFFSRNSGAQLTGSFAPAV